MWKKQTTKGILNSKKKNWYLKKFGLIQYWLGNFFQQNGKGISWSNLVVWVSLVT